MQELRLTETSSVKTGASLAVVEPLKAKPPTRGVAKWRLRLTRWTEMLLRQGTQHVSADKAVYVRQTNFNGLLYFFLDLVCAAIFYIVLDAAHLAIGVLVSACAFLVGSLGFNYLGWTTLSRVSTVSIGSLIVMYCAFYLGPDSFAACCLLLGAIFPFVYFSSKEKWPIVFCVAVPIVCYSLLVFLNYDLGPRYLFQTQTGAIVVQFIFFLAPLGGVAANAYKAVAEREKKNAALEDSKRQLEIVFHALSHDLATPLQTVAILSKFASEGRLTPIRVTRLQSATEQTMRIFQNLIKVSQLTSEKSKLLLMPCSIHGALGEAIAFAEPIAAKKKVKLSLQSLSETLEVQIEREAFIFQVVTNFLTNAVKFSEEGGEVIVKTDLHRSEERDAMVVISIEDRGCGIEAHRLSTLFSWEADTTTVGTLGEKGTGFGLPLAKKFLEAMNGRVEVISRPIRLHPTNHGSEIRIYLPVASI